MEWRFHGDLPELRLHVFLPTSTLFFEINLILPQGTVFFFFELASAHIMDYEIYDTHMQTSEEQSGSAECI